MLGSPFPHLLRERALRAIGIILHAKVFVDLEQPLLVRDRAQKFFSAGIVSKKTRCPYFESAVRQLRREPGIFSPQIFPKRRRGIEIVCQPKRKQYISQHVCNARFANQGHFFWRNF